jgi:hypothetical protein
MINLFGKLKHNVFKINKILYICTEIKLEY